MTRFVLGVLAGIAGVVLVALVGDPRQKRYDSTSLDRQSRRFDESDDLDWVGEWAPVITFSTKPTEVH